MTEQQLWKNTEPSNLSSQNITPTLQTNILTLGDSSLDAIHQHLLQGVVVSADGCGVQHLYKIGHLALGQVVGDGVVPGVWHTLPVNAEHAGGQSVQLARACLDVILCVVLS